jgi:hypothetical protein
MALHPNVEASGLGGFANQPLAQLYLYDKIMDRYYEKDFLGDITNSEISERITSCTQEVQIIKAVDVGAWSPYTAGQEMYHNTVSFTATKLSICYAAYLAFQFDESTLRYTCDWDRYEEKILESSYERFVEYQRKFVFGELLRLASPRTQGNSAGKRGEYNLGAPGSPIRITPRTLPLVLVYLQQVLTEYHHFVEGQMYLITPLPFRTVFMLSDYANQAWTGTGGPSTAVDGHWAHDVNGFDMYETTHLPSFTDAVAGQQCYYVIAGHKDAYAYAADIIGERVTQGENTWSVKYQMLAAWGGAMLYPEFVALAYGYFDTELTL